MKRAWPPNYCLDEHQACNRYYLRAAELSQYMVHEAPRAPNETPGAKASAITHVITFSSATPSLQRCSFQPRASPASLGFNACESVVAALPPKLDTVFIPTAATEAARGRQGEQDQGE